MHDLSLSSRNDDEEVSELSQLGEEIKELVEAGVLEEDQEEQKENNADVRNVAMETAAETKKRKQVAETDGKLKPIHIITHVNKGIRKI